MSDFDRHISRKIPKPTLAVPTPLAPAELSRRPQMTVEQTFETALVHFNAGQWNEADILCTALLNAHPKHLHALNLMGNIALKVDKPKIALRYFDAACQGAPEHDDYVFNRGLALELLGRLTDAENDYRRALDLNSNSGNAADSLGRLLVASNHLEEAIALHQKAVTLLPGEPGPMINLARALVVADRQEEAAAVLETALSDSPNEWELHLRLAYLYSALGRTEEFEQELRSAVSLNPKDWRPYSDLGVLLSERGEHDEAITLLKTAVLSAPGNYNPQFNLGFVLFNANTLADAMAAFRQALVFNPDSGHAWHRWAECLFQAKFVTLNGQLVEDLTTYIARSDTNPRFVSTSIENLLLQDQSLTHLVQLIETDDMLTMTSELANGSAFKILNLPLLTGFISNSKVGIPTLENLLTGLRHCLLRLWDNGRLNKIIAGHNGLNFLSALAQHCFLNEYVFNCSPEEITSIHGLEQKISSLLDENKAPGTADLALLACYMPLHKVVHCERLLVMKKLARHPYFSRVLLQQIKEPNTEIQLRNEIPAKTKIQDKTSVKIRGQYEQNPYPRWRNIPFYEPWTFQNLLLKSIHGLHAKDFEGLEFPDILIAGCGSGLQPLLTALTYSGSTVTAVDLSLTSLAYAERKRREMKIDNLTFAQADILEMGKWRERFDVIECSGVLHHMESPLKGWKTLLGLLKPGGYMLLGLYSEAARRNVVAARAEISKHGFKSTPEGIRRCRKHLFALPEEDPASKVISEFADFYSLSTCRDLLFHEQESRYTLPQIEKILSDLELTFLGFIALPKYSTRDFQTRFPDDNMRNDLACWHQFEQDNPSTFSGMYEFWVRKPL